MSDIIDLNTMEVTFRSPKAGREVSLPWADLPEITKAAVIRYGAMRYINDKLGGLDEAESARKFDEILTGLRNGEVGRQMRAGTSVDPVETKARSIARDRVKAAIIAQGRKLKEIGKDRIAELADSVYEKNQDELMKLARKAIADAEKTAKAAADTIDLDSLGL